jgi:8-oxo-dGTP diphosphatase
MPISDQGLDETRYRVIPRTLVFIFQKNHVLLIKGSSQKTRWAGQYNGIGGHIERNEDTLSAARRELFEETGLNVKDIWLCGTVIVDASLHTGICIFVFKGESEIRDLKPSSEGVAEWVSCEKISELPMVEDLPILFPVIHKMQLGDIPFSARSYYDSQGKLKVSINYSNTLS